MLKKKLDFQRWQKNMAENDLAAFRERWKRELSSKKGEQRLVCAPSSSRDIDDQLGQRLKKS